MKMTSPCYVAMRWVEEPKSQIVKPSIVLSGRNKCPNKLTPLRSQNPVARDENIR
jgi:hypothetical protein